MSDDPIGDLVDRQEIEMAELELHHVQEYVDLISTMDWPEESLKRWRITLRVKRDRLAFLRRCWEEVRADG